MRAQTAKAKMMRTHFDPKTTNVEEIIPIPGKFKEKDFDHDDNKLVHPYDPEFWFGIQN